MIKNIHGHHLPKCVWFCSIISLFLLMISDNLPIAILSMWLSNEAKQANWPQTTEAYTECLCLCFNRYSIAPFSILERCGIKHPKPFPFFGNLMMFRNVRPVYFLMKQNSLTHFLTHTHILYRPPKAGKFIFLSVSLTSLDVFIKDDSPLMTSNAMWFPNRLPSVLNDALLRR